MLTKAGPERSNLSAFFGMMRPDSVMNTDLLAGRIKLDVFVCVRQCLCN